ncbi:superoxide dismutase [Mn], mitochondrial [Colletotrichum spaethianum]|uniref:Superoxide dismutase n=1 Tax=Colletotrichum spaethianum TaxID=700344 RepID=A0AA37P6E9_9PEZI|nr:superoxide dismutase [Mn], mitochondrial [Colletotrichum spaethianum]GKT46236.1 superoxide dismutase [Mn], mitochondrial [Colletotrichum spaethianum]
MANSQYTLPKLPYAYNALEPHISAQIMELHHSKHHQTYVTNLNKAIETYNANPLQNRIAVLAALNFNGGGHINHSLFWENLSPASSPDASPATAPKLIAEITRVWGSVDNFKLAFNTALLGITGSGWGWLVKDDVTGLSITTTKDQDPVTKDVPIFGVDMWEHAYYLQYLNGKAAYVENIWNVINWKTAELRFSGSRDDAFKALKAVL